LKVLVLEKEPRLAAHQTGHNSGVIHSGIYYRPGSLKAATCVAGARLMVAFCRHHRIPYDVCGKLIVATRASELPALETLYQRGVANGVEGLSRIGPGPLRELEPHATGLLALHVRATGIVDYARVAATMATILQQRGGAIRTSARVTSCARARGAWALKTTAGDVRARFLITCAGLHADRVTARAGGPADVHIVPFRGEYYDVIPSRRFLVRTMIYPVPDPTMPFLGVHVTRTIDGGLHAGPNAVLALKREGYRKRDIDVRDAAELVTFPGFWRMAGRYWRTGLAETYRSFSKAAFVRAVQRLVPSIQSQDIVPASAGVRAQAMDASGRLLDDFNIVRQDQAIHLRNVPSPAATASLRLAQVITDLASAAGCAPTMASFSLSLSDPSQKNS
jgi:L-2-hydroxyglutarate oxidase LhgO